MEFIPLQIDGLYGIIEETKSDLRGTLTRVWESHSILEGFNLTQTTIVTNPTKGTLRGIHYQSEPFSENKIVECISGKVFDVVVDLRKNSITHGRHFAVEIGPLETYLGLLIPAGCAHGYLTLEMSSTLVYFMDREYSVENSNGLLWCDPTLSITWPGNPVLISEQDLNWPQLQ